MFYILSDPDVSAVSKGAFATKLRLYRNFPCFEDDGSVLTYTSCFIKLDTFQRSHINQIVKGLMHQKNTEAKNNDITSKHTLPTTTFKENGE